MIEPRVPGPNTPPWPDENHHCPTCAVSFPDIGWDDVRHVVADAARPDGGVGSVIAQCVGDIGADGVRAHRSPGVWSVLEYLCHLRDVYAVYTVRLHRTRTEDEPTLEPMLNDLRARRFGYNGLPVDLVLLEMHLNAAGLAAELRRLKDPGRTAIRRPGEHRSALWLARQTVHETRHHLADIQLLTAARTP